MTDTPDFSAALARLPALVAGGGAAWWAENGAVEKLTPDAAARRARATPPLLVHGRATAARLGVEPFPALDLLDLFAFVRPARFCLPTPHGLLQAVRLDAADDEEAVQYLHEAAATLLSELPRERPRSLKRAARLARTLDRAGWPGGLHLPHDSNEKWRLRRHFH